MNKNVAQAISLGSSLVVGADQVFSTVPVTSPKWAVILLMVSNIISSFLPSILEVLERSKNDK
jgi:hypothetical protein